ncbi:MAG: hypothetical protein GX941_04790 [Candidatus Methanofastidiosa archaeon]|nr:hypothetical protein [Candidatus Methanofastidiosa archaeon]
MKKLHKKIYGRFVKDHSEDAWNIPEYPNLLKNGSRCLITATDETMYEAKFGGLEVEIPHDRIIIESGKCYFSMGNIYPSVGEMEMHIVEMDQEEIRVEEKIKIRIGLVEQLGETVWLLLDFRGNQFYYLFSCSKDDELAQKSKNVLLGKEILFGVLHDSGRSEVGHDLRFSYLDIEIHECRDPSENETKSPELQNNDEQDVQQSSVVAVKVKRKQKEVSKFIKTWHLGKMGDDNVLMYASYPSVLLGIPNTRIVMRECKQKKLK